MLDNNAAIELIQRRRLQLLVHSCIYYKFNSNIISDHTFDMWSKQLVELQIEYPEIAKKVCYAKAFEDWDGSSGAFLPLEDKNIINKALYLLRVGGQKIEYTQIQRQAGKESSKKSERKKTIKQWSHSLF